MRTRACPRGECRSGSSVFDLGDARFCCSTLSMTTCLCGPTSGHCSRWARRVYQGVALPRAAAPLRLSCARGASQVTLPSGVVGESIGRGRRAEQPRRRRSIRAAAWPVPQDDSNRSVRVCVALLLVLRCLVSGGRPGLCVSTTKLFPLRKSSSPPPTALLVRENDATRVRVCGGRL